MHAEKKNNQEPEVPIPDTAVGAIIIDFTAKRQGQVLFWLFAGGASRRRLGRLSSHQTARDSQAGSGRLQFMPYEAPQQGRVTLTCQFKVLHHQSAFLEVQEHLD